MQFLPIDIFLLFVHLFLIKFNFWTTGKFVSIVSALEKIITSLLTMPGQDAVYSWEMVTILDSQVTMIVVVL